MKKLLPLATIAVLAALSQTGCVTRVAIHNPHDGHNADWVKFISGELVTRYPGKTVDEVKVAVDRALDELYGVGSRQGETPSQTVNPKADPAWDVYARSADMLISARIETARPPKNQVGTKTDTQGEVKTEGLAEWTQLTVSYGTFGNLKESQKIVSVVSKYLP